jgi:hypothetical protein
MTMADTLCAFPDRDDVLVTYLYDDMDPSERAAFDAHLAICARCRNEVTDLRGVREHLARWAPPGSGVGGPHVRIADELAVPSARRASWRDIPAWAQVAAALLFLGVSAGLANLEVRYDAQGLSVRTGWSKNPPAVRGSDREAQAPGSAKTTVAQDANSTNTGVAQDCSPANSAPWRADLVLLEQQLRSEMHAASDGNRSLAPAAADGRGALTDAELTRRIKTMIDASEKRQQTELAFRVAEAYNNMRAQRNADLMKVDSVLGALKSDTNTELLRQRASINYLVSATQKQ